MTLRRSCSLTALIASLLLALAATPGARADAAADLQALFDREWERQLQENPAWASRLGDRRWNTRWPDLSIEAFGRSHARDRAALEELQRIPREALAPRDQLNHDLFARELKERLEAFPHGWWTVALDQRWGFQSSDELATSLRFQTTRDYEDWLARMRALPAHGRQTATLLREGIRRGRVQPKVTMQRVPGQLDRQIVGDPGESPFFRAFREIPESIPAPERERLRAEAREVIRDIVIPTYREFREFFVKEYLPACRDEAGIWALPGGNALYALFTRQYTTRAITPDEVHEIGLREVKRIRERMEEVRKEAQFNGSLGEFFHFLRTDPQFFHNSPLELLAAYQVVSKRIDPTLVRLFRTLPRTPYGVERIPDAMAPDTTMAYYNPPADDGSRAGGYFVNLYRPETRPKWEMMALSLHEAVPGHHLQIALAQEQGSLPNFRRHAQFTAFIEGWALYAESLGYELGLYTTPYDRMGQLTYEMWRAVRLVIDTGIHARRWDRDRAISYFRENAPKGENDIVNEVDRYLSWPGQALAYKIGELVIKDLRARAERELGDRFDIRAFHDAVLLGGALPLEVLEQQIQAWIATRKGER